jgi:hypothetical protein
VLVTRTYPVNSVNSVTQQAAEAPLQRRYAVAVSEPTSSNVNGGADRRRRGCPNMYQPGSDAGRAAPDRTRGPGVTEGCA